MSEFPAIPQKLSLGRLGTPLENMPRLSREPGGPDIYFKRDDLTGCALSGNKIRKLEFSLAEAMEQGASVVMTAGGIQSNHCRATALCCAKLGLECHLILRGGSTGAPDGNLLLDHLAGARFSFFPDEQYTTQSPAIVEDLTAEYARQGKKAYWIPVGASNPTGSLGYFHAYGELMEQAEEAGIRIDHVLAAVGSGGTLAGLIAARALDTRGSKPSIWGVNVCHDAAYFEKEIRGILEGMKEKFQLPLTEETTPVSILDGYVGKGYAIPYDEEMELIARVAAEEGQILDPVYTGKAFYGLSREIAKGRFGQGENVVFLHTGGIFGIFPQREAFGIGRGAPL